MGSPMGSAMGKRKVAASPAKAVRKQLKPAASPATGERKPAPVDNDPAVPATADNDPATAVRKRKPAASPAPATGERNFYNDLAKEKAKNNATRKQKLSELQQFLAPMIEELQVEETSEAQREKWRKYKQGSVAKPENRLRHNARNSNLGHERKANKVQYDRKNYDRFKDKKNAQRRETYSYDSVKDERNAQRRA
ncbi:MAG: hypothetical protein SGARI_005104, partial [Bacillariaceae sp.]